MSKSFKWDDSLYVEIYKLAKNGLGNKQIAQALGITGPLFYRLLARKPLLKGILKDARSDTGSSSTFIKYIYDRLPSELKDIWKEIEGCEIGKTSYGKLSRMLEKQGKRARQHLFFHALVSCNFSESEAMRKVCIPQSTLNSWKNEPEFVDLVNEFHFHKKNFFESALIELVRKGSESAIIFANKTINRDRGYNDKVVIEHQGEVAHTHQHLITMADIEDLPLETKLKLLEKIRAKSEPKLIEDVKVESIPSTDTPLER